jgi:hypothetical protein
MLLSVADIERINAGVQTLPAAMPMSRGRLIAELAERDAAEGESSS